MTSNPALYLIMSSFISSKFSMCGPKINEQLKSFVSIGLCPPWLLNEPPTIAISDNLKKFLIHQMYQLTKSLH